MGTRVGQSVRQLRAAAELKRLRELALLTADEVAQRLGWSPSKVSRVENARIRLKPNDVRLLLGLYDVAGSRRDTLLALVQDDGHKKWWEAYADILSPDLQTLISFEAEASTALNYEPMVIPGLLQTPRYARRIIHMWQSITSIPPPELDRRFEVRMTRQRIMSSDDPLDLSVIIDEAVLRRQIDDRAVMREQLHHLADASEWPNVTLHILPLSGAHVTSAEPFISFHIPNFGEVLCIENFLDSRVYIEDVTAIYHHKVIFDALKDAAIPPEESRRMIRRLADELWAPDEDGTN